MWSYALAPPVRCWASVTAPSLSPRDWHNGSPPGTESRDRGAGVNTQQVTGVQAPGTRRWHGPGALQSRAVPYCTSPSPLQQLPAHFPELLLLEGALESPDFAELLEVISEDIARNVFQCMPAKADSEVFGKQAWGYFYTIVQKKINQRLWTSVLLCFSLMGWWLKPADANVGLNSTRQARFIQPKSKSACSQEAVRHPGVSNFTRANGASATTAHHGTLSGHVYGTFEQQMQILPKNYSKYQSSWS